jgi:trk system potassium uptake protein TrkA
MKAIIVGAGNVGGNLARKLCEERYDVVLVDVALSAVEKAGERLDILTIPGNGADPRTLLKAGIEEADLLAAVTARDEVNILSCVCARAAGVRHKVARLANAAMLSGRLDLHLGDLGVDFAVSPNQECAREILGLIRLPGAVEIVGLFEGRAAAAGLRVSSESPLLRTTLKNFPDTEFLRRLRFIALRRGDHILTPTGDTQLMIGDEVYLAGPTDALPTYADVMMPDRPQIKKVIVSGGGNLGFALARQLEASDLETVVLEADEETAEACSGGLRRALVVRSDGVSSDALREVGVDEHTAFVATTDDDEMNIISCLLAEKSGASLTIAQVIKPEYVPVIESLSLLDRVVSTHLSVVNAVLRFVRGRNVRSMAQLQTVPGELIEVVIREDMPWAGKAIRDLRMPKGTIIACTERAGEVRVPTGDLVIQPGDRLAIYALPEMISRLHSVLKA